jgi:hypothetical protein
MALPVLFLVVKMGGRPLPLTIVRELRVLRVRAQLLAVIVGQHTALTICCDGKRRPPPGFEMTSYEWLEKAYMIAWTA